MTKKKNATPVTFCEIFPPDNFPLWFYRKPSAPDMQVKPSVIDFDAVRGTRLMWLSFFFFQAEDGIRDHCVTGVQTCALPISRGRPPRRSRRPFGSPSRPP